MSKGFTLLELLIVIAILAVLTTVVILVLNPAEYLAQARDSQRMSDLSTLNSALSLYLSTASTISLGCTTGQAVCTAGTQSVTTADNGTATCASINSSTAITGTGWVPVNFSGISGGSPVAKEPLDPTNTAAYHYAYSCNTTNSTYKLSGIMESAKYKAGGTNDISAKDGGVATSGYELGTDLTIYN